MWKIELKFLLPINNRIQYNLLIHKIDSAETDIKTSNRINPGALVAEWVRLLNFSALNHSIISPL